jgi:hypothetical protein
MPKRKRDDPKALETPGPKPVSKLQSTIDKKVEALVKVIKLACRFERQKLSRRQKEAVGKRHDGTFQRINDEIDALNAFDAEAAAKRHLRKRLLKIKSVERSAVIQNEEFFKSQEGSEAPSSKAYSNLNGRLFKADVVKEVDNKAVDEILRRVKKMEEQMSSLNAFATNDAPDKAELDQAEDLMEIDDEVDDEFGSVEFDEETLELFASRVVGSSESESEGSVKDSEDEDHPRPKTVKIQVQRNGQTRDLSISLSPSPVPGAEHSDKDDLDDDEDDEDEDESSPQPNPPSASKKELFLPTLTEGGYISGSDSASDSEIEEFSKQIAPRKNRRGQKERQAIAERKYGWNANHLKKGSGKEVKNGGVEKSGGKPEDRNAGWDIKRGAVGEEDKKGFGKKWSSRDEKPEFKRDDKAGEPKVAEKKKRDDTGPLHPSWVAKKAARSKEKQVMGKYEGKKVVFD